MGDIPAGWLALAGTLITAVGAAFGFVLRDKEKDIDERDKRIEELQARVDSMQQRQVEQMQAQLGELRSRRYADERLVGTLQETSSAVDKLVATAPKKGES